MTPPSLMKVPARAWMLAVAMSVATSAQPQSPPPADNELKAGGFGASQGVFRTFGSGSDGLSKLGARLKDPQERAKMRAEHRESIVASHYGVAEALQLDAATMDKLIELLTDQQMKQSEDFYRNFTTRAPAREPRKELHDEAERMTQQIDDQLE